MVRRLTMITWLIVFLATLTLLLITLPNLPEVVALKLKDGQAIETTSSTQYAIVAVAALLFWNLIFSGLLNRALSKLFKFKSKAKLSSANIPWKSYWTESPEREQEAWSHVWTSQSAWAAYATLALALVHLNLMKQNGLSSSIDLSARSYWIAGGIGTTALLVATILPFKPPKDQRPLQAAKPS